MGARSLAPLLGSFCLADTTRYNFPNPLSESQTLLEMHLLGQLTLHITDGETEAKGRGERRSEVTSSGHMGTSPTTVTSQWEARERGQTPSALTHECVSMKCLSEAKGDTEMSGDPKLWDGRNLG